MERILILLCALSAFPISTSKASPILTIFAQARHTMAISSSTEGSKTNSNILHYQNPVFAEVTNDEQQILGATSTMNPASTTLPPQQQQILKDSTMTTHQMQQNYSSSLNFTCSNPSQTEYKGKCLQVLQRLPCPPGEWLVEDAASGKGTCVENKCPNNANTGFYKGRCVKLSSENCPRGMRTYIYKTGVVDCDCKDGHIYNSQDGFCYEAYRQGPCKSGMVFISTTDHVGRTTTMCKRNPCKTDGYYCSGGDFKCEQRKISTYWVFPNYGLFKFPKTQQPLVSCIKFGSPCTSNGQGVLVIHPETNQPYCQQDLHDISLGTSNTRIIGNVPIFKCAAGSRRDILGNCRTPTVIDFS